MVEVQIDKEAICLHLRQCQDHRHLTWLPHLLVQVQALEGQSCSLLAPTALLSNLVHIARKLKRIPVDLVGAVAGVKLWMKQLRNLDGHHTRLLAVLAQQIGPRIEQLIVIENGIDAETTMAGEEEIARRMIIEKDPGIVIATENVAEVE